VIVNTIKNAQQISEQFNIKANIATVGATKIAMEVLGVPITNTTMIGAVLKATNVVKIESVFEPLRQRFGRLGDRNIEAMKRAYLETVIEEFIGDKV
jgi:pyruvate ferredoxin oxidoreductase gamma subunit